MVPVALKLLLWNDAPTFLAHLGSQESKKSGRGPGPERRPCTPKFWTLGDGLIDLFLKLLDKCLQIVVPSSYQIKSGAMLNILHYRFILYYEFV